jgi:hypothetical protein
MARLLLLAAFARAQNPQLSLNACTGRPSQLFYFYAPNATIITSSGDCVDLLAWGTAPGTEAYTAPCHHEDTDPAHQNQEFTPPSASPPGTPITGLQSKLALTASAPIQLGSTFALGAGTPLFLNVSSPANGGTGTLVHADTGLCVDADPNAPALAGPPAVLRACSAARGPWQTFSLLPGGGVQLLAADLQSGATLCLSAADATPAALLEALPCAAGAALQNFSLDAATGRLLAAGGAAAADTLLFGAAPAYEGLATGLAPAASAARWSAPSPAAGPIVHAPSGLCLDFGRVPWGHGCLDPAQRALPYCDAALPVAARVGDLLGRLTTAEKVALTGSGAWHNGMSSCDTIDPGVPRLSLPPKQWLVETNSMAASQCFGAQCATAFPSALNLAASGNRTLWREKGRVLSDEMRALNNVAWHRGDGGTTQLGLNGFGPDINQPRDPRNGRAGELVSEDPFLTGAYAVEMLKGMQEGEDARYLKMSAGVKHVRLSARRPPPPPTPTLSRTSAQPPFPPVRGLLDGDGALHLRGQLFAV